MNSSPIDVLRSAKESTAHWRRQLGRLIAKGLDSPDNQAKIAAFREILLGAEEAEAEARIECDILKATASALLQRIQILHERAAKADAEHTRRAQMLAYRLEYITILKNDLGKLQSTGLRLTTQVQSTGSRLTTQVQSSKHLESRIVYISSQLDWAEKQIPFARKHASEAKQALNQANLELKALEGVARKHSDMFQFDE